RHAAALDVRLSADLLRDVERALENLVQPRPGMLMLQSEVIGLLELAKDFGLAENERVEAAGDLEEVLDAVGLAELIQLIAQRVPILMDANHEILQLGKRAIRLERGGGIELDPVAGGKDDRLIRNSGFAHGLQC